MMTLNIRSRWYAGFFLSAAFVVWWTVEPFLDPVAADDVYEGYIKRVGKIYIDWCMSCKEALQ